MCVFVYKNEVSKARYSDFENLLFSYILSNGVKKILMKKVSIAAIHSY